MPSADGPNRPGVTGGVRIDAYRVIADAVERGVSCGVMRAHKHTDSPDATIIEAKVEEAVMFELCEVLRFDDEPE